MITKILFEFEDSSHDDLDSRRVSIVNTRPSDLSITNNQWLLQIDLNLFHYYEFILTSYLQLTIYLYFII